jgi:hypothetical protein
VTTLIGLVLMAGGIAVLAMVRPWRTEPDDQDPEPQPDESVTAVLPRVKRSPSPRRPSPGRQRRHRVEMIQRARHVPAEPGRPEIPLPDWLGPVSGGPR